MVVVVVSSSSSSSSSRINNSSNICIVILLKYFCIRLFMQYFLKLQKRSSVVNTEYYDRVVVLS